MLHSLRKLRFLDCYEITDYEKEIIQKEKQFYGVITYKGDDRTRNIEKAKKKGAKENWTPLPEPNQEKKAKSTNNKNINNFRVLLFLLNNIIL